MQVCMTIMSTIKGKFPKLFEIGIGCERTNKNIKFQNFSFIINVNGRLILC